MNRGAAAITLLSTATLLLLGGCAPSRHVPVWESLHGPTGRNITALLVGSQTPARLLAGTTNGDLFLSTDSGTLWTKYATTASRCYRLVQHPERDVQFYAGTDNGLLVSSDSARNWSSFLSGDTEHLPCRSLAIDPWDPGRMYAGLDGKGVFRSTDGGRNWGLVTGHLPSGKEEITRVTHIEIHQLKPDVLGALITGIGVLRSTDGGTTWTTITSQFTTGGTEVVSMIMHPALPEVLCVGTSTGEVYRSTNAGATWALARRGNGYSPIRSFVADPSVAEGLYAGAETGLLRSSDFGSTWSTVRGSTPRLPLAILAKRDTADMYLYAFGEGAGVILSTDSGSTWRSVDRQPGGSTVNHVALSRDGRNIFVAVGEAICRTTPDRPGWITASNGLPGTPVNWLAPSGFADSSFCVATNTGAFFTSNNGEDWDPLGETGTEIEASFLTAHPFISNRFVALTRNGIMVTTDHGRSWSTASTLVHGEGVRSMIFHPANAGIVVAAASEGLVVRSTDGGLSWDHSRYGMMAREISAVTLGPTDQKTVFAWSADGTGFRSTDGGLEWAAHVVPWNNQGKIMFAVDYFTPSRAAALVDYRRIFLTEDGGETWTEFLSGEPPVRITAMQWSASTGVLYAGTADTGLFLIHVTPPLPSDRKSKIP